MGYANRPFDTKSAIFVKPLRAESSRTRQSALGQKRPVTTEVQRVTSEKWTHTLA